VGFDVRHPSESGGVVVAVLLMLFICLFLPLLAMLYFDTLTLQKKTEKTEARIEKMLKNLEEKEKK
jgi:preprotein translocase subunit YajC